MIHHASPGSLHRFRVVLAATLLVALAACATTPPATSSLVLDQQATIEGAVVSVDTAPWAYDGNAVVVVSTAMHGNVSVQLPARWNLCKAKPPENLQAFKPGDRVQAAGTATAPDELVVCGQATHRLQRIQ